MGIRCIRANSLPRHKALDPTTFHTGSAHPTLADQRYSRPAIFFHWAIAILIGLGYLAIEIRGPKGSDSRIFWSNIHYWAGTLVLTLAFLRVLWPLWRGAPAEIKDAPVMMFLARLVPPA